MKESLVRDKSYAFALKAIQVYQRLDASKEWVLSKQMLKAATSIGANVEEALAGQSRADFLSKMSIADIPATLAFATKSASRSPSRDPNSATSVIGAGWRAR